MPLTAHGLKRGIYETDYGNVAYVSGPKAKSATDLDGACRIPIILVTRRYLRRPTDQDMAVVYRSR